MKYLNKIIFFSSLAVFALISCPVAYANGPQQTISMWGYEFTEKYAEGDSLFLEYNKDGEKIELHIAKNVDSKVANEIISDEILLFESLFKPQRPGYPGQHTTYIECPPEFKPQYFEKELDGGYLKYFIAFANANYVAGASSADLVKYKAVYGFLYSQPERTVIEIDYFVPLQQSAKISTFLQRINCALE